MKNCSIIPNAALILLMAASVGSAVEVTVLNEWTCDWAPQILGMDILEEFQGNVIVSFVSDSNGHFDTLDPSTGQSGGGAPLAQENDHAYGIACNDDSDFQIWYFSDTADALLYRTEDEFGTWTTRPDPSGGGGMAHHEDLFWVTDGFGTYYFTDNGDAVYVDFSEGPEFPCDIAVFESLSQIDYAVLIGEGTECFCLYDISTVGPGFPIPLGYADFPFTVHQPRGLAYSSNLYTFFWSYELTPGDYRIAELDMGFTGSFEGSTWGALKSIYQ